MQMKNSDRIVNLKGIALSIFAVIVGISLNILFTLKFNETHIGIRVAATDVLIPFILFLLLMQVIKKKEVPVLITPFGYRLLAVMSLWLSICLVNGYLSSGVLTNWAFLNKYIGWFVLMSYFAAGLYISEQNLQIKNFFFRSLFVTTWLVCISEIIIHWFYIVGFFHQYHYIARHERMEGLYQNPNAFGIFLAVMFVLHIQAMRDGSRVFNKWIIAFGSSVVLLCLYYSYSRSAWLGAVLGLIVAIIIDKKLFARVVIVSCIALMGNYLAFSDQTKDYNAKIIKYFYYDVAKVVGGAAGLIQYFEKQKVEGLTNLAAATGDVDITGVLDSDGATTINGITVSGVGDAVEVTTDTGDITFNPSWYLKQNPDVEAAGEDPYRHYLMYGAAEGRLPKPESFFSKRAKTISGKYFGFKQGVKKILFTLLPFVFWHTQSYKYWKLSKVNKFARGTAHGKPFQCVSELDDSDQYVSKLDASDFTNKPVSLIASYLPQFHSIPENDEWWGKGFTEWTNVQPAKPQFEGHYQPHVPGDLGYYDLGDVEVMRQQTEMAKLYGISGFSFYFYWFGGTRLLENPILQFLENTDIDFPFCLCWANENWSRRWDGRDNDILISQNHSTKDDLDFIEYVSKYMKDQRYIRIDGKPVLLIYRPSLLISAKDTASSWRDWCRKNGIGEIYLAYTQSFESVDPATYGFDAAIEFPPNNMHLPLMTDEVPGREDNFTGQIYDWNVMVERSADYEPASYKLFRGVNPAWDNTARKKSNGNILYGASPFGYQRWLYNAVKDTVQRFDNHEERIVFVNAWNEWAEGAHLEPDQRYGYAYLEATRMALLRASSPKKDISSNEVLAIVIHAFYIDVFEEILVYLKKMKIDIKLYVTTPHTNKGKVENILNEFGRPYFLLSVDNKGRDILPFLKIMPFVIEGRHSLLLKLHTKKSNHREDGNTWRNDIFEKLLLPKKCEQIITYFNHRKDLGMVGPQGHVVDMTTYWGSNKQAALRLAERMGVDYHSTMKQPFVAGTMFYARVSALQPLLNLSISEDDFDSEKGQVDGTFAHAVERAFSISLLSSDMGLANSDSDEIVGLDNIEVEYQFVR